MSDDRSSWERRLEALDEQLATLGVRSEPAHASDVAVDDARAIDGEAPATADEVDVIVAADVAPAVVATDGMPPGAGNGTAPATRQPTADVLVEDRTEDHPPAAAGGDGGDGGDGSADEVVVDDEDDAASRKHRALVDWVVVIGVALLIAFLMRTFVLAHFVVDGESMESTLHSGDRVFVNKLSYRLHDPNRGDVVVLHELSGTTSRDLIKRVVALPGEVIEVRDCQISIDGRPLEEPYLDPEALQPGLCGKEQPPLEIPDNHVFVMGDNRGSSMDSRDLGPVDEDNLVGRAFVVFWPSSDWKWL